MRSLIVGVSLMLLVVSSAAAGTIDPSVNPFSTRPGHDPWHVTWLSSGDAAPVSVRALALPPILLDQDNAQPLHKAAVEHSSAYQTRAKIHKYASFATLPLFAAEVALGTSLYNTPANADSKRAAHGIVGAGIVGLFGVNTVTGAWNLFGEGWRDKEGRTRRLVHGLLMMAADVGFVATSQSGPNSRSQRQAATFETDKVTHRNLAIASVSVGTVGYLMMLFGNH
jgi:hypothetical protein